MSTIKYCDKNKRTTKSPDQQTQNTLKIVRLFLSDYISSRAYLFVQ